MYPGYSHVARLKHASEVMRHSHSQSIRMTQAECLDHVLVLAVKGKFILDLPAAAKFSDLSKAFREAKDCLVGRVTVDDALVEGQTHRRRIKLSSIAETGDGSKLANGVVSRSIVVLVVIALKDEFVMSFVCGHALLADRAGCDEHFILHPSAIDEQNSGVCCNLPGSASPSCPNR